MEADELDYLLPQECQSTYFDTWDRHNSIAFSTATKGLHNAPGENNCFVNSAVQVFWHLDVFRRSYRRLSGHTCMGNSCIFCALKVIFTQFQFSDQSSLHPDALRKALAETFVNQQRFQLGHMDDAAECFENILRRIHFHIASNCHEDACTAPHCLPHQKFALNIIEKVVCPCGASSKPLKFTEMVHYISAKALISQAQVMQETGDMLHPDRFGLLLRNANAMGDIRDCPGGCGKSVQIRRTLLNSPDVVSIGLVWDSDHPTVETTTEVARNIGTAILLQDVFHSVMQDLRTLPKLQLVGLVCYYGKHYSTFVFHSKLQVWIYFDDATVREIGKCWEDVVDKCSKGRYQPLLLLYANPNANPVTVETAPKKRTMAPGFGIPGGPDDESGLDRTQESISSQQSYQRSWTPNPDSTNQVKRQVLLPRARSVTPSTSERENGEPSAKVFDHSRQQSFIMAMSTKPDKIKHPLRFGGQASSSGCTPGPMIDQHDGTFYPSSSGQSSSNERDNYSDYTLSTSGQYRRPSMEGFEPARLPLTPNIKGSERKDAYKKEPIRADVVRYLDPPGAQDTASSTYMQHQAQGYDYSYQDSNQSANFASKNGIPSTGYQNRQRSISQNCDEIISNIHNEGHPQHIIVKPMANPQNYDQREGMSQSHTPVQSGLATLPRKKKDSSKELSRPVNNQPGISGNLSSVEDQRIIQNVLGRPPPVPVSAMSGKVDVSSTDKKPKKLTKKEMKKAEKKLKSELSRSQPDLSEISKPFHLLNSSDDMQHPKEFDNMYINRSMVESILKHQGLQRNQSTHSTNSSSSIESASIMGKPIASKKSEGGLPTDTSFDNVSIGSHKDSGYGSSDRNSSSSAGSGTVDPHIQYFLSKSMVVPRNAHQYFLQHPPHQMISDFSTPKPQMYNASINHPDAQRKDFSAMTREERNQQLFETLTQRKVMHPIKESSQEDILKVIPKDVTPVSNTARVESPSVTDGLSKEARTPLIPPKNFAAFQVSKSSHQREPSIDSLDNDEVENDYFISMCTKADDLMDSCIIAETKGDLTGALRYCDSALGCLKEAMNQTDISNKALVYAQKKHNACLLKSRSLFKRNSTQGTDGKRSSITSSDSDNSDRPIRRVASKEHLLTAVRGAPPQGHLQHGRAGSPAVKLPLSTPQQVFNVAPQIKDNKLAGPQSGLSATCASQNTQASYGNLDSLSGPLDHSQAQSQRLRSHVARSSASDKSDTDSTHSRSESNSSARSSISVPCPMTQASSKSVVQNRGTAETASGMATSSILPMPLDSYGTLPRNRHPRRTSDPTGSSDALKKGLNKQSNVTNTDGSSSDGNVLKRINQSEIRELVDNSIVHRHMQQFGVQSQKFTNGVTGDPRQQMPGDAKSQLGVDAKSQLGVRLNDDVGHGGSSNNTYTENNVFSNSHSASACVDRLFPNSYGLNISTSSQIMQQQRSSNCQTTVSSIQSADSSPQFSSGSVQLLQQPPQHSQFILPQSSGNQCPSFSYHQQTPQQHLLNQQLKYTLEGKGAQPVSGYSQPLPGHRSTPTFVQPGSTSNVLYAAPGSSSQQYSQAYHQPQNMKHEAHPQLNNAQVNSSLVNSQFTASKTSSAVSYRATEQNTVQNVMQDVQNHNINRKSSCGPPPPPPARTTSNPDFKQHLPPPTSQPQQHHQLRYHHLQQHPGAEFKVGSGSQPRNVARIQPTSQQKSVESSTSDSKPIGLGSDHSYGLGGQLKHATSTTGLNIISQPPRPLERYASQPDCQNLVDPASYSTKDLYPSSFAQGHTLSSSANARSGDVVTKNLAQISDITQKQNNHSIQSHSVADFQNEMEPKPNVRALASKFDPVPDKPAIKPKPSALSLLRTRSRSESGSKKPKSVLKSKKNKSSKAPRKCVTFAEDISNYAAGYESAAELTSFSASGSVNDRAYFSDDDDNFKMKTTSFSDNDLDDGIEDSSNSDDISMVRDELACHLCHKREVDMGKAYCSKCSFYMSRLVQT